MISHRDGDAEASLDVLATSEHDAERIAWQRAEAGGLPVNAEGLEDWQSALHVKPIATRRAAESE